MEKEEWHKRYKEYMLELGVPEKEAEVLPTFGLLCLVNGVKKIHEGYVQVVL